MPKRYTVTAALPYANGPLHIGHIAGAYLPADIYCRFLRIKGEDVVFVCGSDEHGAAITLKAKKEGLSPKDVIDKYDALMRKAFDDFGISFDIYHRTSQPIHYQTAQEFFEDINRKGEFEVLESEQFYDPTAESFLADRYIQGGCPKCDNPNAYGDQCERCGSSLSPSDLINPRSTLSGSKPVLRSTQHWYLPMQNHEKWIKEWISEGTLEGKFHHKPQEWKNHVLGQCLSWIESGLQSRSMTRDLDWGVPVPGAPGKVLYVWLDAPIGYISATKAWAKQTGKDWKPYWQDPETELIHFIGKDNIVFHCIIFPIILKLKGGYILPKNVPANEFLNLEGGKLSTSRNWAVWLHEYLEDFKGKQDVLRYVLTSILPENKDSEFTWADFQARNNNELAAILGNFVNRVMVLTHKYFGGKVPEPSTFYDLENELLEKIEEVYPKIEQLILSFKFREALFEAMNLARLGNKYLAETEPWKLWNEKPERVQTILYMGLLVSANLALVFEPFLPETSAKLSAMLNLPKMQGFHPILELSSSNSLNEPALLFDKIEDAAIAEQLAKLEVRKAASKPLEEFKKNTDFENFKQLDIRVGTITKAEKIAKAKKLLKLTVNDGLSERTIVSGIAESYEPQDVEGAQVLFLANLESREIKGVVSQGMVLTAEQPDGTLTLVVPKTQVREGSVVK
jgi:methionyl-tRNA synthetase